MSMLLWAIVVLKDGTPLPFCNYNRNGMIVQLDNEVFMCDAQIGQWLKIYKQ